jgi:DNA-directed RNA polymerase specialized sigma24 family protein
LIPLVYDEPRRLAAARLHDEGPGHTLDATALVHEAYLRLVGERYFEGRGPFFAAAAEASGFSAWESGPEFTEEPR